MKSYNVSQYSEIIISLITLPVHVVTYLVVFLFLLLLFAPSLEYVCRRRKGIPVTVCDELITSACRLELQE